MKLVFLGRNRAASLALTAAVEMGFDVVFVVAPSGDGGREYGRPGLAETALDLGLAVGTLDDLSRAVQAGKPSGSFDLLLSFLYWRKIPPSVFEAARVGAFNMHPGPLPGFKGARGYNHAILEGVEKYGATLHWMSEEIDGGEIAREVSVPVRTEETALSLYQRTMRASLAMVEQFLRDCLDSKEIKRRPQSGKPSLATRAEMIALSKVDTGEHPEAIARKAKAFWFPPFAGATIELGGREFTVVDSETLKQLGDYLHGRILDSEGDL